MNKVGVFNVAVAVCIERGDKILITQRSMKRDHAPGEWEAGITGRIDQNESAEAAAHREVKEETGLEVELIAPYHTFHFYRGTEKAEHIGVSFWAKHKSGEVELDTEEQSDFKWVTPQEALSYITNPNVVTELNKFIEFRKRYQI